MSRGRPKGSGYDEDHLVRAMEERISADPGMSLSAAARATLEAHGHQPSSANVRRMLRKMKQDHARQAMDAGNVSDAFRYCYRFTGGQLRPLSDPPDWFRDAWLADDLGFDDHLKRVGCSKVEEYSYGEMLIVWKHNSGTRIVDYTDTEELVSVTLIDDPGEYTLFRAMYIAPLAQIMMSTREHDAWLEDRKK
ncbi:hypothetical protein [Roseomonas genomospecies 6]|uniref:Uncharacterized protein n=1 Tax=Roseomonas genomospecies 6 TaxID=214106 RepID=A0A9W7NG41_9PROT|nr:hypothetical protein [Roseomonas genomospecies 6]KAA0677692.1 hypothetical protein DS843_22905 [Roseomonas genomospecies 6]